VDLVLGLADVSGEDFDLDQTECVEQGQRHCRIAVSTSGAS
jgi:hypothetical protein